MPDNFKCGATATARREPGSQEYCITNSHCAKPGPSRCHHSRPQLRGGKTACFALEAGEQNPGLPESSASRLFLSHCVGSASFVCQFKHII